MNKAEARHRYPIPWQIVIGLFWDTILLRSRSFRTDALRSIQLIAPRLKILNKENVPSKGPGLLVMNHYCRPGFDAWWIALGISAVVPAEIHWMMTNTWTHAGVLEPVTRWLFPRLGQVYGFTTTPPMPPVPHDFKARAQAVRCVLKAASSPDALIGLAPEGADQPGGILGPPPPGAGRFIHQLSKRCQRIIPIGVYDDADNFYLSFGPPYHLEMAVRSTPAERDRLGIQMVMMQIASQLPPRLRGEYKPL